MAQFIPHVNPGVEAGDAIRQAIALQEAKRMAQIAAEQKMAQQNFENRISMGKLGVDQGRLGLDSNRFGLDVERFDRVDVPKSAADIANLNARTGETTQGVDIKNDARRIIGGLSKVGIGGRPSMSDAATLKLGGVDVMTPTAENFSVSPEQQGGEAATQINATASGVDPSIIKGLFGAVPQQGGHVGLPGGLNVSKDSSAAMNRGMVPIVIQGPSGPLIVNRTEGTATPVRNVATGNTVGRAVSPVMAEKLAGIEQSVSILDELNSIKDTNWLGPIAGRAALARVAVPGFDVNSDLGRFYAQTQTLKNSVIKAITGAQMSEPEAKRIMGQVPDFTDKPELWQQKYEASINNLIAMNDKMTKMSGVGVDQQTPVVRKSGSDQPAQGSGNVELERGPDGTLRIKGR